MKKFKIISDIRNLNNVKIEELRESSFTINSNSYNEVYFNGIFVGVLNYRKKTSNGWEISIRYLYASGAIAEDVITVERVS